MPPSRRHRLFIDPHVQSVLVGRVAIYWVLSLCGIGLMTACWIILTDRPATSSELVTRVWQVGGPPLLGSLMLLPVAVIDMVRLANRFVGPIWRLRTAMRDLADGRPVKKVEVRKSDFWKCAADDFNRVIDRLRETGDASPAVETAKQDDVEAPQAAELSSCA